MKSIIVSSSEPVVPWELVHLTDEDGNLPPQPLFLGQMGLVRELDNISSPSTIRVRDGRVRTIIPNYPDPDAKLPEAEQEFSFLRDTFAAQPVEPQEIAVRALLASGDFDLLHFAGHGAAPMTEILDAAVLLQGRVEQSGGQRKYLPATLDTKTVKAFAHLESPDNQPMVVLNACQAGRTGRRLTRIGGFADAFMRKGAGAFIATLWSVGDSPARTFTETLYSQLLKDVPLSEAAVLAREASRDEGDATWLAYVVYGHPFMRLVRG
jgi:CHAT domain-containing protein